MNGWDGEISSISWYQVSVFSCMFDVSYFIFPTWEHHPLHSARLYGRSSRVNERMDRWMHEWVDGFVNGVVNNSDLD